MVPDITVFFGGIFVSISKSKLYKTLFRNIRERDCVHESERESKMGHGSALGSFRGVSLHWAPSEAVPHLW